MPFRWMRGAGSAAALAAALLLAGCGKPEDADAIEAAAVTYVQENGGVPGTAEVEEVSGDYARALVTPGWRGAPTPRGCSCGGRVAGGTASSTVQPSGRRNTRSWGSRPRCT